MFTARCIRRALLLAAVVLTAGRLIVMPAAATVLTFRPPAVPVLANNPYFSMWSAADSPGRSWLTHANDGIQAIAGYAKVDGANFRFMGQPYQGGSQLATNPISVQVLPLSTIYTYTLGAVRMLLTYSTPALLDDDALMSAPVTYCTFELSSMDGAPHTVDLYIDHSAEVVVTYASNTSVTWDDLSTSASTILRMGASVQSVFSSTDDRINWGYFYLSAPKEAALVGTVNTDTNSRDAFVDGNPAPIFDTNKPRLGSDNWPVPSLRWTGLAVSPTANVTRFVTHAYDNVNTMNFFSKVLPPLWSTKIGTILTVIAQMHTNYATYMSAINARNTALVTLFDKRGSNSYTTLLSLVYRQVTASTEHAIDTTTQQHYVFMKTFATSSTNGPVNGQVNAVTTMFFASPFYLLLNPSLVPKMLLPVLKYANSETSFPYTRSWAPSHLGQWPLCTTAVPTTYDMPVEHTANMLIMITAAAQRGAPLTYLQPYWPLLTTWANYLVASLPFPTSQLFVDSYGTASANNVNLAMKGAIGVGAYSLLLSLTGNTTAAAQYMNSATSFASQILAQSFSTDHYLREKGAASTTWSLKYNLLFDRVLKLGLFADAVMTTEQTFYTPKMGAYGLPVDSTTSANGRVGEQGFVAATGTTAQFTSIFDKLFLYANTTASRLPLGDYYVVGSGANVDFRAGAFVGGLYARELLEDVRAVASTSSISARAASTVSAATASSASLASFSSASIASASSASLGSASSASIASASSESASIATLAWLTSAASAASANAAGGDDGNAAPAIIGAVVGALCLLLIILVVVLLRRRRARKTREIVADRDSACELYQIPTEVKNILASSHYDTLAKPRGSADLQSGNTEDGEAKLATTSEYELPARATHYSAIVGGSSSTSEATYASPSVSSYAALNHEPSAGGDEGAYSVLQQDLTIAPKEAGYARPERERASSQSSGTGDNDYAALSHQ
ncbi:hypothetical protein CAOG_00497 [Capsaspora owczarzaki ATCC 30864]|uniref:Glutaminase n=1 Tax=Capsaspora owczarzaki (strain ATCC 30864) TaxID=595528 RepID=A0A0D2WIM1_CAPO3|nr:hypothetical protein CAOG_00497 [Capsaspora owczarzaki ATCC 30864]KJE88928.1 hypothetical protein, variant [Capsaspora owczarzaki ATCC 30864]|eukprot:XP_004365368.2 hypothetical protein CAOG_00497 [Capsaspora owczarzaki ATCC 30864]